MKFELETTFIFEPNGKPGPTIELLMRYQNAPSPEKGQPSLENTQAELAFFVNRFRDTLTLTGIPKSAPSTIKGRVIVYKDKKSNVNNVGDDCGKTCAIQGRPYQWQSSSYFINGTIKSLAHEVIGHGCFMALIGSKYTDKKEIIFFEEGLAELFTYYSFDEIHQDARQLVSHSRKSLPDICNSKTFGGDASYDWSFLMLIYMRKYAPTQFIKAIQAWLNYDIKQIKKIFIKFISVHDRFFEKWLESQATFNKLQNTKKSFLTKYNLCSWEQFQKIVFNSTSSTDNTVDLAYNASKNLKEEHFQDLVSKGLLSFQEMLFLTKENRRLLKNKYTECTSFNEKLLHQYGQDSYPGLDTLIQYRVSSLRPKSTHKQSTDLLKDVTFKQFLGLDPLPRSRRT